MLVTLATLGSLKEFHFSFQVVSFVKIIRSFVDYKSLIIWVFIELLKLGLTVLLFFCIRLCFSEAARCPRPLKLEIPLQCSVNMLEGDTGYALFILFMFPIRYSYSYNLL